MPTPKLVAEAERLGILPKTEYRPEHYRFAREQSQALKALEWEGREEIKELWPKVIVEWIGFLGCLFIIYLECWR